MFGRLIGKIGSLTSTAHFRRFNQIEGHKAKKGFPAGISKFEKLVDPKNIFVDKSLLITKLLDTKFESFLITRPRRWGKTLNLDMVETFFQADMNKDTGMPDFTKQSKKHLFKKLLIGEETLKYNLITGEKKKKKIDRFTR